MSIQSFDAMSAYAKALQTRPDIGTKPPAEDMKPAGGDFSQMVENAVTGAAAQMRQAEMVSRDAIAGRADLVDMVTAVNSAELAMETVVAVRDKVIGAYQDIMRMPI